MPMKPLRYSVEVGSYAFWVREIEGVEEISRPWRLTTEFLLDPQTMRGDPLTFDPDDIIKQEAFIVLDREHEVRRLQGVITEVELGCSVTGHPEVRMVIEPRFALLRHRVDIRIHRNLTVPQIVQEVVEALGVKIELRLRESYDVRPYCVQYRESDFDYCNRLLEDEGIFYFFTAGDVMVLGDNPASYEDMPGNPVLPFRAGAGANRNEDAVHDLGSRAALTPGKVTLRDWNTEHPSLDMDVSHPTDLEFGPEWYDYPGEYEEPSGGSRKARLHAEAFDRGAAAICGGTTCARLYPGAMFILEDAPLGSQPGKHVIRKLVHRWNLEVTSFAADFEADPEAITYRAPRSTFVPRIFNPHTGIVCTNGDDIQCDKFGRVKIHFHWDRLRPYDDDCSHWVPVLQDNTGGSSAIPRKDWEMMVHFLEGDPDRPVVLGRVYNGEDVFTERLPQGKTRSGLRSLTTPSREGSNEIRFEDMAGAEQILVHAERDQNVRIANNQTIDVWQNNEAAIHQDETISVGNDATWSIGNDMQPTVGNDQSWEVSGNRKRTIGKSDTTSIGGDHNLKIGGNYERKIYAEDSMASGTLKEDVGSNLTETYKMIHDTGIGKDLDFKVGGSYLEIIGDNKGESTVKERKEDVGGAHIVMADGEVQMRYDKQRTTTIKGSLSAKCPKDMTLSGVDKIKTHSATGSYTGDTDITFKVGDTIVMLKDKLINIKASEKIALLVSGKSDQATGKSSQI